MPKKPSKKPEFKREFLSSEDVAKARAQHSALQEYQPNDLERISREADEAIAEIEDIFTVKHPDQLLEWIHSLGIDPEELQRNVSGMRIGSVIIIGDQVFTKTPDLKVIPIRDYIYRVEQAAIFAHREKEKYCAALEAIEQETFWQTIRRAFRRLRKTDVN